MGMQSVGGEAEQAIDGVVAGRVDVLTDTQAIELDWLKGKKSFTIASARRCTTAT